jgi:lipopolysaccharide/colanic/teichoic acid biosynthesis glycosyltransferase
MNRNTGFQFGHDHVQVSSNNPRSREGITGLAWDYSIRLAASLALLGFLPIFAVIWIYFKCADPGPMLFKQSRPGYQGKSFLIYKIRTMRIGAEKNTALGTQSNSSEVTKVGRILRTLKIDEAPQLLNIIRGDMAIVGPRPIPEKLDAELKKHIPGFETRYTVKPGLTSIGQICVNDNALGDALVKDWRLRFEGELHYIRNKSVRYDLVLIGMTAAFVFKKLLSR